MTTAVAARRLSSPPSGRAVVLELALFEARRGLRHPLTWIGALASVWMMWALGGEVAPILPRDSVYLAGAMLPLAASTLLVTNQATLRHSRTPELLGSSPRGAAAPTQAAQLSVVGPVVMAALLQAAGVLYLFAGGPVGWIDWWELAVGPVMVAVLGLMGVLIGRRLPHAVVAPVVLVGLGFLQLIASPDTAIFTPDPGPTASVEWLAPWMPPSAFDPVEELATRPSELHLVYLVVLGLVLAILTVARNGRRRLVSFAAASLFVATLMAISVAMPSEPVSGFDWIEAADAQVCESDGGIEYCAFGFYEPWIPRWQETVDAVDSVLPVAISQVWQRPGNISFEDPGTLEAEGLVLTTTAWDRQGAVPRFRFRLALDAAHSSVGLPTTQQTRTWAPEEIESIIRQNPATPPDELRSQFESEPPYPRSCSAAGQARAVVAVWLAASAIEGGEAALGAALAAYPSSTGFMIALNSSFNWSTTIGRSDAELAERLVERPTDETVELLGARWAEVIDPDTTSTDLASWFGLPVPSAPDPELLSGACP